MHIFHQCPFHSVKIMSNNKRILHVSPRLQESFYVSISLLLTSFPVYMLHKLDTRLDATRDESFENINPPLLESPLKLLKSRKPLLHLVSSTFFQCKHFSLSRPFNKNCNRSFLPRHQIKHARFYCIDLFNLLLFPKYVFSCHKFM